ncbi:zona pellucida sperm-binding protein 4-like [Pseudophryne corroboree]|uniref:zona pellucida sperm-binding protein 4-like n=1 Tax=Pseudophryne corroboree TaxID=495146 RepID=UPI003081C663
MSGWGKWLWVWGTALLGGWFLASAQRFTTSSSFYEEPSLVCGDDSLEYSLQVMTSANGSVRLSVQDAEGELTPLITEESCGIWAVPESGSMQILVRYDSCYMKKMADYYIMAIVLEVNITGYWEVYEKEDLRCPVFQVKDSPTSGECSDVPIGSRLPCASSAVTQDICLQNGCCYDQTNSMAPCYYGNKVTAQCTTDGKLTVAISMGVTVPALILASVKFQRASGPECDPIVKNDAFLLFSIPLSACGTRQTADGTTVVYENDLVADRDVITWGGSSITRDSLLRLHIRCRFIARGSVPLKVEVFTLPPPRLGITSGRLTLEMRIAQDARYTPYYADGDYPILKVLRDPVFIEVRILRRNDLNLVLMLEQCWATTSESPVELPQWPILVDGCPFEGDNYKTQLVPVGSAVDFPSHYKRFVVSTFTFVDQASQLALGGLVYFHCSASVCVPSSQGQCVSTCTNRKRRDLDSLEPGTLVSAHGAIDFSLDEKVILTKDLRNGYLSRMEWIVIWAFIGGSTTCMILFFILLKKRNGYIKKIYI